MKQQKIILLPLILLFFLAIGFLVYFYFFRSAPLLEEKFVIETPTPLVASPAISPAISPQPTSSVTLIQPGEKTLLPETKIAHQTFNNCGPATLSMVLSYYDIFKSQKELGEKMRPWQHPQGDNDDKTIFPTEFVEWVEKFGLKSLYRPNGTLNTLKLLIANGIPVVLKTWLKPKEDIGHFRIIRGFDEKAQVVINDDSYFGPNRRVTYFKLMEMWQPFNYAYLPVFKPEKEALVKAILAEDLDIQIAYQKAINRAQKEAELDPDNVYPVFNLVTAYYHLGEYEKSIEQFEKVKDRLPRRMLWYQIEPILAYYQLKNYAKVFEISDWLFNHGNRAFSELYQLRGEIYLQQNNPEAARREFELALKYNQNYQPAQEALLKL